jgi:hypothetical protein
MDLLKRSESLIQFNGISNSRFKGHKTCVAIFPGELSLIFPKHEEKNMFYSFDSWEQLQMERKQREKQEDILSILIHYPEERTKTESIIVSSEDAANIFERFGFLKKKMLEGNRTITDFSQVKDIGSLARIEFTREREIKNYNYGTLYLSNRELKFNSYSGKDYIIHLDYFKDPYYYQTVILDTDILGYKKWVSVYKISVSGKEREEAVTFLTDEKQAELLKQLFEQHYDTFLERWMIFLQEDWENFSARVEEEYNNLLANDEIVKLSYDFIDKTHENIFLGQEAIFEFEFLLRKIHDKDGNKMSSDADKEIEISPTVLNFLENSFLDFVKLISEKSSFEDGDIAVFSVWKLLKALVIQYYHDFFMKNYDACSFENFKSLSEYINAYAKIEDIDVASEENIAIFTYFLMKSYWQNEDNFVYYFNTVRDELKK